MKPSSTKPTMIRQAISISLIFSFAIANLAATQAFASTTRDQQSSVKVENDNAITDLTQLGRQGRLLENLNLEAEAIQLIKVLGGKGVRQPLILDEKNENQDILVEQVAIRIANGSLPRLADRRILKLEAPTLFSHVNSEMEAEARLNSIIDKAIASKGNTILYVPRFAGVFTTGRTEQRIAASILRGELKVIAGSSFAEYADKIERDPMLAAAFELVKIGSHTPTNSTSKNSSQDDQNGFRGQKVAPDLKRMIAADPSKRVDLIVQAADADSVAFRTLLANGQARIVDRIGRSDMLVVNARLSSIEAMAASGMINYVSPNRATRSSGHIEDTTGATAIRSALTDVLNLGDSVDGSGVGIAVLDSGIYLGHNGFKKNFQSRILANVNFTNSGLGDAYGHGTHVAGLAVGNDNTRNGAYRGIAPDANLISVKVLDDEGVGETSWLLNGLDWVLQNKNAYNIKIVNLSLGTLAVDSYTNDPLCLKVKEVAQAGIVVIAAAGNLGKNSVGQEVYGTIHSPGNSPYAITVGASNTFGTTARDDDSIATYSSRGPTRSFYTNENGQEIHDNLLKPDLVAPGNKIISSKPVTSALLRRNPNLAVDPGENETADDGMMYQSGTSMSAPVVAGAAALLFEVNPNLTPGM
ncbi:MAG TPA: S8 family serine peptidase, partial [Pyrinomonadaceae bacterium]|nr:S8 family serine peptidase [Pyrinomonadaceae bacterium]